jgi:2-polyprenyl-3-methyl-5-hydroxy-6-metoxy-1,4-benzoquinol methylase
LCLIVTIPCQHSKEALYSLQISSKTDTDYELQRWSRTFAGEDYYYGEDPGLVARRVVRYHRPFMSQGKMALDVGCGEGQDLAFLAEQGYEAVGIDFTPEGVSKSQRLLQSRGLRAEVLRQDIRDLDTSHHYDLVLAVNSLQFMGADALLCLNRLMKTVAPGGIIGLSLFARNPEEPQVAGTLFCTTLEELLERFSSWQLLEAAKLWQWNTRSGEPQAFATLIARNVCPAQQVLTVD